jgi:hypothetical protein
MLGRKAEKELGVRDGVLTKYRGNWIWHSAFDSMETKQRIKYP